MLWRTRLGLTLAGLAVSLVGCGDDDPSGPPPVAVAPNDVGGAAHEIPYFADARARPPNDLDWQRCSLMTDFDDNAAECAQVAVPLDWTEPTRTITLFVKRYRGSANPTGQVWLLNGGPGASGADLEDRVAEIPGVAVGPTFLGMAPQLEVYLLDHRGTGRSSLLECAPAQEPSSPEGAVIALEEWPGCRDALLAEWGTAGLAAFNITQAARDLGELIGRTRHGSEPVFVYGVSYGTLWAQRYLALYPTQPTGVVLDSICAPGNCRFALGYDQGFNQIGKELFAYCANDAACSLRLGPDPWARLGTLYQKLDAGHCPALNLDRATLRQVLASLLTIRSVRDYIPAVIARLDRCSAEDVQALGNLLGLVATDSTASDRFFSQVLNEHIILSELMEKPLPSEAETEANLAGLYFSLDVGPALVRHLAQGWPTYAPDQYAAQLPSSSVPLLMLSGELDPQTPPAVGARLRQVFNGPLQTFVSVPYSTHGVLDNSAIAYDEEDTLVTCGELLVEQFLNHPDVSPDPSCVSQVAVLNFAGTRTGASVLFNSASVWGEASGLTLAPADQRAFRRGRRVGWRRQ